MTQTLTEADRAAELHRLVSTGRARKLREQAGLTLALVARSIGTDRSVLSRWEKGTRRPTGPAAAEYLNLLRRLAKFTGPSN